MEGKKCYLSVPVTTILSVRNTYLQYDSEEKARDYLKMLLEQMNPLEETRQKCKWKYLIRGTNVCRIMFLFVTGKLSENKMTPIRNSIEFQAPLLPRKQVATENAQSDIAVSFWDHFSGMLKTQ